MRCRFYWPDIARTVAGCDKNSGRMSQDCWPDAARILAQELHIELTLPKNVIDQILKAQSPDGAFFSGDVVNLFRTYLAVYILKCANIEIPNKDTLAKSLEVNHHPKGGFIAPETIIQASIINTEYAVQILTSLGHKVKAQPAITANEFIQY